MTARLFPLALVLAAVAHAQPAEAPHRAPTLKEGALLSVVAAGTSLAAISLARSPSPTVGSAVAVGAAVLGTSSALGLRPALPGVLLDAAAGAAAGVLARELYLRTAEPGYWTGAEATVTGVLVGGLVTGATHVARLRWLRGRAEVAPAALAAPTGESGAGLRRAAPPDRAVGPPRSVGRPNRRGGRGELRRKSRAPETERRVSCVP